MRDAFFFTYLRCLALSLLATTGVPEQGDLNAIPGRAGSPLASPNYASVTRVFCVQIS